MTSVGIMASSVVVGGTDVLLEPFTNLTAWTVGGTFTTPTGRTGTAAQNSTAGSSASYAIAAPARSDVITIGFAFRWTDATVPAVREILRLAGDAGVNQHNRLTFVNTGRLVVQRTTTTLAQSAAGIIATTANVWHYIELQIKLHNTLGYAIARVDGAEVINATSLDTFDTGTATVYDTVRLAAITSGCTNQWDDLYITTGAAGTFKGDITIP